MWALRILTGPQTGKFAQLKLGKNLIGRSAHCDIPLQTAGVSKEHAEIHVQSEKIFLVDLHSANGTYINGVKIQNGLLKAGDKVGVHDILLDVVLVPASMSKKLLGSSATDAKQIPSPASESIQGSLALQQTPANFGMPAQPGMNQPQMQAFNQQFPQQGPPNLNIAPPPPAPEAEEPKGLLQKIEDYLEYVALPGVYKLPELTELKVVIALFIAAFAFAVTLLSLIPMTTLSREAVLVEGKRRAMSMAKSIAQTNQTALLSNNISSLSTNGIETEEGVKDVLIIQQSDGMTLAPAGRAGATPDISFVHSARREMKPQVGEIEPGIIGSSFPIGAFDPNTGDISVKAHTIVMYDVKALSYDDGRVISLFMQTLVIALVIGAILFFFLYKLIEYPIRRINDELDEAMRESKESIGFRFQFPELQDLISNINSLLGRSVNPVDSFGGAGFVSHDLEMQHLTQINSLTPMSVVNRDGVFVAMNERFGKMCQAEGLAGLHFSQIPDPSLPQNIEFLMAKCREVPQSLHEDQLEFAGTPCLISCCAFLNSQGEADYFIFSITPLSGEG